ncbi:H(2):CoB-CoM heterodisulfide,ferredoxin reductase subunit B [Candidatus Lokiarchaeum ossiferum]|uniref:H(2):CoB-CoM heterodisulfide,ferredoxin reductase subunit B n=1 Tax=Candidatus Lokiarchaeum ossiferum TaxID=2951803 RepID=A0ABY6HQG5_9ARCH|nr:H(2):CoB-CoM heterodisulfide,ferredoxin reductase subunit B [Candidatus Lokiarchaeum sp. B-35]
MESEKISDKSSKELNYSLFLGCVIPNRYPMIERASRTLFDELNIKVDEMEGASCCPAPGVFRSVDKAMWLTVGARNINIAEQNHNDLLTLCNGCNGTLNEVDHQLKHNEELKGRVNEVLSSVGRTYTGTSKVRHIMDVLYYDIGVEKIKSLVKRKLNLNVAVHYGCHILKPAAIQVFGQDPDDPTFFDEIVEATGATSIIYRKKMMCCGAGGAVRTANKSVSSHLTLEKLREIRKAGADCIVVCCPFCQLQYDLGQLEVANLMDEGEVPFQIPVIYITQLLGLAMGIEPERLGMIKPADMKGISPFTSQDPILEKVKNMPLTEGGN